MGWVEEWGWSKGIEALPRLVGGGSSCGAKAGGTPRGVVACTTCCGPHCRATKLVRRLVLPRTPTAAKPQHVHQCERGGEGEAGRGSPRGHSGTA